MHDVEYQSINNMEVSTIIKDGFIGHSISCCNVAFERAVGAFTMCIVDFFSTNLKVILCKLKCTFTSACSIHRISTLYRSHLCLHLFHCDHTVLTFTKS